MPVVAAARRQVVNPYAKPAQNDENMGRQSQQRVSNQHKRKFKLAQPSPRRRRKGDQLTLDKRLAFQPERDCQICKAKKYRQFVPGYPMPHRGHHELCIHNKVTRGQGAITEQSLATLEDNKRYKALTAPIQPAERHSAKYATKPAIEKFFKPIKTTTKAVPPTATTMTANQNDSVSPLQLSRAVKELTEDAEFREKHKSKGPPLAMIAFAHTVQEKIINGQKDSFHEHFKGIEMEVPVSHEENNPQYHSIIGQKLLYLNWQRTHGILVPCPVSSCNGTLENKRSNFSKNQTLFPVFGLDGSPIWCMVMVQKCPCCHRTFYANEADVLVNLPECASSCYPVETTYAIRGSTSHLNRHATEAFASVMVTYGNGELCSKLLYNAINRDYIRRITICYSIAKEKKAANEGPVGNTTPHLQKDGEFIRQYSPHGNTIRDMYDTAASSQKNHWCISDHDRHIREIQSVKCTSIFAQDHTFQVTKNYQKKLGATAAWDAATDTGEIACAVLVRSTKTEDFSHAAQQLMRRQDFKPRVKYSDTWPHKQLCWEMIIPGVKGRLGLFHYQQRVISTLRKNHADYFEAVTDLLACLYVYCEDDYERLLEALKNGTLSRSKKKCASQEIAELKRSRLFRDRHAKHLRKKLHKEATVIQMLDDWFCRYKVTSSDPSRPAQGRLDPTRFEPLFTADTKLAIENCKDKAKYLSDALPLEEMYEKILPNPNSPHQLTEYLSKRGESKLEAFHDRFAHFANCGMRNSLADNLNLAGTARHNLSIRQKRSLVASENPIKNTLSSHEHRKKTPAGWEDVVAYFNHSELWHINRLAATVNCLHPGFVKTKFGHNNEGLAKTLVAIGQNLFAINEDKGAATSIYLADSKDIEAVTGKYFVKSKESKSSKQSHIAADREYLWDYSEKIAKSILGN